MANITFAKRIELDVRHGINATSVACPLSNLRHKINHQTVGKLLKHHGLAPAPERGKKTPWKDFIRSYMEVLVGMGSSPHRLKLSGNVKLFTMEKPKSKPTERKSVTGYFPEEILD